MRWLMPLKPMQAAHVDASFWRFTVFFALFIGFLGFLPHALFSYDVGGWHYMANAWDEDSYTKYALEHKDAIYRMMSATLLRQWVAWFGLDTTMMLFDVLPPMVSAMLAAGITYYAGFRTRSGLFVGSCVLLFALALLGVCNVALTGTFITKHWPFSSFAYPDWVRMFVPSMYEQFFSLYKSPEPQITFIIQFAALLLLLRHAQMNQGRYVIALAVLMLTYPFIYITTGIALMIATVLYAVFALFLTRKTTYAQLLAVTIIAAAFYVYCFLHQPPADAAAVFIFASRQPIISISMLWAVLFLFLGYQRWGRVVRERSQQRALSGDFFLVLACCAVPFITLNQQIITGVMVQSRIWDGYTNLPFVAVAFLLMWPELKSFALAKMPSCIKQQQWIVRYSGVMLALWLVIAQLHVAHSYRPASLDNLATARMLAQLRSESPKGLPALMLDNVGDDSQVALRLGPPFIESLAGYQQTLKHHVAPLGEGNAAYEASILEIKEQAFTYFDRKGLTPETLEKAMVEEAQHAIAGPHIIYFFSLMDSWKPLSDYRRENVAGMLAKIPALVADYRAFLGNKKRRMQFGELLYVTQIKSEPRAGVPWRETLAREMTLGSAKPVTVYIYRQTPR